MSTLSTLLAAGGVAVLCGAYGVAMIVYALRQEFPEC